LKHRLDYSKSLYLKLHIDGALFTCLLCMMRTSSVEWRIKIPLFYRLVLFFESFNFIVKLLRRFHPNIRPVPSIDLFCQCNYDLVTFFKLIHNEHIRLCSNATNKFMYTNLNSGFLRMNLVVELLYLKFVVNTVMVKLYNENGY
jgi:hypothetical protein